MATVVLQAAGAFAGTMLGGPMGGMIGRALGAVAGSVIDQQIFGAARRVKGPRLSDLRVMGSSEGAAIPRIWGRMRVAGQVIWAAEIEETRQSERGGKGSPAPRVSTYSYFGNFAVGLCEGVIDRIGRVWADGKELDLSGLTYRLYAGSEMQAPDSLIVARLGAGNAPAYRGLAYVVFERMPLADFGNRLPQLSFEVIRSAGGAEGAIRAVSIIPGSTEFGYDTAVVTREAEEGVTETENAHALNGESDWSVSIGQLTASCRNLGWASLVTAWFGTDLRCGVCEVKPGVSSLGKRTEPEAWGVSGTARAGAHLVSMSGDGPAYGGTPSDASVIRAIQDLKARGVKVMFHPFLLMDIPAANGRPDPYGASEQAAYPWRGRITCSIAPGRAGSPDKSDAVSAEIAGFLGTASPSHFTNAGSTVTYSGPPGWGYRRMVLHYAKLCALAGGVDAFLIGSELRGLTALRRSGNVFPFVEALVTLAAEVKAILPGALISYGADWSEYGGHRPADGTGDVFFHLDPLWSSPHVGFVGIDNYMPLADWRDGSQHLDLLAGHGSIYDPAYLEGNIAGGEGFDWYYRNQAERNAQIRTPITDGAHGKPWVFRTKDLVAWWSNAHVNRPGGIESAVATGWAPRSKPIWFTEAGCAAVDKAANQPNAFIDAKSGETALPHFSSGARDDLMQNRYVSVLSSYWSSGGSHNPVSPLYGGPMVDGGRIFFWAWDARPFPQFPARADVWSDAVNYGRGHWLNGRIGALPLGRLIEAVCAGHGLGDADAAGVEGLIGGFQIERPMSGREALEDLMRVFGIDAVESGGRLRFFMRSRTEAVTVAAADLAEMSADQPLYALTRAQEADLPVTIKLAYLEAALDYRLAAVEARKAGGTGKRDMVIELPAAVSQAEALKRAEVSLQESWSAREQAEFALPPSFIALEPGDVVRLALADGPAPIRIEEISDGAARKIRGRSFDAAVLAPADAPRRGEGASSAALYGRPSAAILDLPLASDGVVAHAPWLAAAAKPWPGSLAVNRRTGSASFSFNRLIEARATMGFLTAAVAAGPLHLFDRGTAIEVQLTAGELSSVSVEELLQGANAAAIGSMETGWEIIQFAEALLTGERRYRLSFLLRGRRGSEPEMLALRPVGQRFVLLDEAVVQPVLSAAQAGLSQEWRIGPPQYDLARGQASLIHAGKRLGLRPLAPCHLRAQRSGGGIQFTWIRRSRFDTEGWEEGDVPMGEETEAYRLQIMSGATVKRTVDVSTSEYLYAAAQIADDFGAMPSSLTLRLHQLSTSFGPGAGLERTLNV